MIDISTLRDGYLLRDTDPSFAVGHRANLVYAVESLSAGLNKVNSRGPDPLDYLEYAKRDLTTPDTRGAINALGNAKRAIHLSIDALLKLWGLTDFARANFPR